MATGKPPFYTASLKDLIQKIVTEDIPVVSGFSAEFNDLVRKLLHKDPVYRINWEEIKNHPWWSLQDTVQTQSEPKNKVVSYKFNFTKRIYQP
jgi:serine/threonine protein kinase